MNVRELVESIVKAGVLSETGAQSVIDSSGRAAFRQATTSAFGLDLLNGRTLEFTVQPMENGGMVVLIEDITERKIAEAKINHLARFDALTGLPNRTVLRDRMERALNEWRTDNMCAIHFIDLDQFKQVNDTLGHTRGDMLLEAVAERLKNAIRDADVISRFGGDEFVILQAPIKSIEQGEALATRVLNALGRHLRSRRTQGRRHRQHRHRARQEPDRSGAIVAQRRHRALSGEGGRPRHLALVRGQDGSQRPGAPGAGVRLAQRDRERSVRAPLSADLQSQDHGASRPARRCCDGRTTSAAWCRRREFIPVAEEMGLIVEIGNPALYKACLECRRWPGDTAVAVNLSSIQFDRSNVPALVRETLAATNLPAHRLEIEITETTLLQNTRRTRADLQQLAEIGVKISLDDFGTAYSSLSYLHSFPFHKVKIDQSFLKDLNDDERRITLLRGMTRLSAQLGLRVVVEGVETDEQLELLAAEDSIDEVQGYLLCRPMPAADLRKLLYASYVAPPQSSWPARVKSDAA